jgi:hypothetical protein
VGLKPRVCGFAGTASADNPDVQEAGGYGKYQRRELVHTIGLALDGMDAGFEEG